MSDLLTERTKCIHDMCLYCRDGNQPNHAGIHYIPRGREASAIRCAAWPIHQRAHAEDKQGAGFTMCVCPSTYPEPCPRIVAPDFTEAPTKEQTNG